MRDAVNWRVYLALAVILLSLAWMCGALLEMQGILESIYLSVFDYKRIATAAAARQSSERKPDA